jgi:hypothetical protein
VLNCPLEVIRTRLTLSNSLTTSLSNNIKYNGIIHCTSHIFRTEGLKGLFKGLLPAIVSGTPYVALQMTFYEQFKYVFPKEDDFSYHQSILWGLTSGSLSALFAQSICYPMDTVRRRMATNGIGGIEKIYQSSYDCLKKMMAKEGIKSFFKGYNANLLKALPTTAIQFTSYDIIKKYLNIK